MNEVIKLPLWKSCLDSMRESGIRYGQLWEASFFESSLRCNRNSAQFAFEMLALKQAVEEEDGYYLRQINNGSAYETPSAPAHEDVAKAFESKMRRYAVRSIGIRSATLTNSSAELTQSERVRMERNLEKASVRLILISRQKSVEKVLKERFPKLLAK